MRVNKILVWLVIIQCVILNLDLGITNKITRESVSLDTFSTGSSEVDEKGIFGQQYYEYLEARRSEQNNDAGNEVTGNSFFDRFRSQNSRFSFFYGGNSNNGDSNDGESSSGDEQSDSSTNSESQTNTEESNENSETNSNDQVDQETNTEEENTNQDQVDDAGDTSEDEIDLSDFHQGENEAEANEDANSESTDGSQTDDETTNNEDADESNDNTDETDESSTEDDQVTGTSGGSSGGSGDSSDNSNNDQTDNQDESDNSDGDSNSDENADDSTEDTTDDSNTEDTQNNEETNNNEDSTDDTENNENSDDEGNEDDTNDNTNSDDNDVNDNSDSDQSSDESNDDQTDNNDQQDDTSDTNDDSNQNQDDNTGDQTNDDNTDENDDQTDNQDGTDDSDTDDQSDSNSNNDNADDPIDDTTTSNNETNLTYEEEVVDQDDLFNNSNKTVFINNIDEVLINPGIGISTFNNENSDVNNYPEASVAYYRWYWKDIHPNENSLDWNRIERAFREAEENDQKIAFRIMAANGEMKIPQWLFDKGVGGTWYFDARDNENKFMPDFEDPILIHHVRDVMNQLGERYDNSPLIDHVDIGFIGHWGEWHFSRMSNPDVPSDAIKKEYVDIVMDAFPNTPIVMLVNDRAALRHAVDRGAGWRGDCLGDWQNGNSWTHMLTLYPRNLEQSDANDAWKQGPVAMEPCAYLDNWYSDGINIRETLDYALDYHISVLNLKSKSVPDQAWDDLNYFLKRAGYRYEIKEVTHEDRVQVDSTINLNSVWENVGVAPAYKDYKIAFRLRDGNNQVVREFTNDNIRSWIPGTYGSELTFDTNNLEPGTYSIDVAMFEDLNDNTPDIKLAIVGKRSDGWYELSSVEIV